MLFVWQHSPESSFSLVCVLQHFVLFIDMIHILLFHQLLVHPHFLEYFLPHYYIHICYKYKARIHPHASACYNDNDNYNFYSYSSFFCIKPIISKYLFKRRTLNLIQIFLNFFIRNPPSGYFFSATLRKRLY